jgi:hypothetical protein
VRSAVASPDADESRKRVTELLEEYFGTRPEPKATLEQRFEQQRKHWVQSSGDVLIATVPDPAESRVGYTFDQQIDALVSAVVDDVLYLHPTYTADLLGMWVASTDPTDPEHGRIQR